MTIIERALEMVTNGMRIGLGRGRAARAFVKALGQHLHGSNLRVFVRGQTRLLSVTSLETITVSSGVGPRDAFKG
jgi:ribose 5-phosphate isomerase